MTKREYGEATSLNWFRLRDLDKLPKEEPFLLWRAINEDGGFPTMARRVLLEGRAVIRFHGADDNWIYLEEAEYRHCRWAKITPPELARKRMAEWKKRMETAKAKHRERMLRKEQKT